MNCWMHEWTKWKITREYRNSHNETVIVQKRECEDCGKIELREVVS